MNSDQQALAREPHSGAHDGAEESPFKRMRTAAGLESGRQMSLETAGAGSGLPNCEDADETCAKGGRPGRSVLSHVATEQRRRDKINEGFLALRELIPHKDKMDKATFLQQAVEYIRQLQAVMHQLLSMGAVNGLPEDLQWAIRMLLPRKEEAKTAASEASTKTTAAEAALSQLVPPTAYLPYLLQPQQLAVLTQHAQQAKQPAVSEAPKPAPPAPSVDLNQLQAMLQQQQAAQQLQAQQAARAGMWPDQTALWQLAQLQQMMQGPAPPQFCAASVQLPTGPPKARKSSAKLRKHTSAAKIAKPEAVRPAAQAPGRPDAMSMMQV
ncbi:hypothetical protein WJX82_003338 [Trebouxia sp. C0006]